jgi:hypothetical protein
MAHEIADLLAVIRHKRQRLAEILREADSLRSELQQIEKAAKLDGTVQISAKPKSRHGFTGGKRSRPIQPGSSVDRALLCLQAIGEPLTADQIVDIVNKSAPSLPRVKKDTLVSNLTRYVQHGDTFTRPAPNTYGLVEFDAKQSQVPGQRQIDLDD